MVERIRDVTVAEAIAAEAGTDATPELSLGELVTPVLQLQPRPPLAVSGYIPGTVSLNVAAVALNTSHGGIYVSGFNNGIGRVNWLKIINNTGGALGYTIGRVDSPFTGFPSVPLVPGYSNAGNTATRRVFSVTKSDTVGRQGIAIAADIVVQAASEMQIDGPWILNNGILVVSSDAVDTELRVMFGYESWPAIRDQPPG